MEFPDVGTHCAVQSCSRLDFLPFECDSCHKIFCKDHRTYENHSCEEGFIKDVKVPVCPLCNQPVPVSRGEDPNIKVDEHIQKDCQSDKAKKLYTNRCSHPGCKKKELVPVKCNTCLKNFCLKHRFETDHDCQGHPNRLGGARPPSSRSIQSTAASSSRGQPPANRKPQSTTMSQIGAELNRERLQRQQQRQQQQYHHQPHTAAAGFTHSNMTEDEALALAIAASMSETSPQPGGGGQAPMPLSSSSAAPPTHPPSSQPPPDPTSYEDDEALARAIAASLNDEKPRPKQRRVNPNAHASSQQRPSSNSDSGCHIS